MWFDACILLLAEAGSRVMVRGIQYLHVETGPSTAEELDWVTVCGTVFRIQRILGCGWRGAVLFPLSSDSGFV
jgi:hypothetical protein